MNVQKAAPEKPPEVEQLVNALVEGKLAKYVLNSAASNDLIKEIAAETGLPRVAVRIAFKLIAPLVANRADGTLAWFGRRLLVRSADMLIRVPGYARIAGELLRFREKLDLEAARRRQLDAVLAGQRLPTDVEHAEGLSRELRLGLRQLAGLHAVQAHWDVCLDELLDRLNPQPPLTLKLLEQTKVNRLKFGAQRVPFVGREREMARLREFLDSPRPFTWWLVTGSGGQGKSRLALELCLRAGTAWRGGFLPETATYDEWDHWQPESATLIVVDYVAMRGQPLRRMLTSLLGREHTDPLEAPVRVLLLERSKERWWDQLISSDQTGYAIEQCQFEPEPLKLGPMSEDDLWQTIAAIAQAETPLPERAETLAALGQIDPERRPLFAAFAADALAVRGNIRGWDRERLLRDVLERERCFHWKPAGVTIPFENLLCLATMVGGLPITVLEDPPHDIELPALWEFKPAIYEAMTGARPTQAAAEDSPVILERLQPDIFGEFFVLEHLKPPHPGTNQPVYRFKRAAANLSFSNLIWFLALFLIRAKDDFTDHATLSLLTELPIAEHPHGQPLLQLTAMLTSLHIINLWCAGRVDEAQAQFDEFADTVEEYPEEAVLRLELAKSAERLISAYSEAGRIEDARAMFGYLGELAAAHPEDAGIRLRFAEGAFTLISAMTTLAGSKMLERSPTPPEMRFYLASLRHFCASNSMKRMPSRVFRGCARCSITS